VAYNTAKAEHYSLRTITAGNSQSYRVGDQFCPDNGWLLVWSCSNADQLTLRIQAKVAGPGHLSAEIINGADMSRHGLLAVPWPILDLDVSCDSADTDITLSAYAIDHQSGIGGWPSRIYRTERKTIASGATGDFDIPTGASKFWVGSTAAATVKLQDSAGDDIQGFALATGNVTIGAASSAPWYTTAEGGRVRITQSTGSNQTYAVVYEYDLTVGSGLA
jgi:hypothetical protein